MTPTPMPPKSWLHRMKESKCSPPYMLVYDEVTRGSFAYCLIISSCTSRTTLPTSLCTRKSSETRNSFQRRHLSDTNFLSLRLNVADADNDTDADADIR